jgi:hypothetical protein
LRSEERVEASRRNGDQTSIAHQLSPVSADRDLQPAHLVLIQRHFVCCPPERVIPDRLFLSYDTEQIDSTLEAWRVFQGALPD